MIRKLLVFFFAYLLIEGALRKWVLPEAAVELFIAKDVLLLLGVLLLISIDSRLAPAYHAASEFFPWVLWILFVFGYFLLRNPSVSGLAGLRYYLAPLPLLVLVPYAIGSIRNLHRMAVGIVLVAIPMCILGAVQYMSPLDSEINKYAWTIGEPGNVANFGISEDLSLGLETSRPRVTSTFSYISTYAAFLSFAIFVGWVVLLNATSNRSALVAGVGLFLCFTNLAMTGSRAAMGLSVLLSAPFAYLILGRFFRGQLPLLFIFVMLVPLLSGFSLIALDAFMALAQRNVEAGDAEDRVLAILLLPLSTLAGVEPLGRGIGDTFAGLGQLSAMSEAAEGFNEGYQDRVAVELGYAGYLLVLYLKVLYIVKTWSLYRKCVRVPDLQVWALTILVIQIGYAWQIPFHNAIASSFYFASLGLFFWLRTEFGRRLALHRSANRTPGLAQYAGGRGVGLNR